MIVYLSGPMRGLPDNNLPAFHAAAAQLRTAGYEVLSPAEYITVDIRDALRWDCDAVLRSHAVVVLDGWEKSLGAKAETALAAAAGMPVIALRVALDRPTLLTEAHEFLARLDLPGIGP